MSCGVGRRRSSDLVLLWLWCRLVATALIRPLAWEPPYAEGVALKRTKYKKKKKKHGVPICGSVDGNPTGTHGDAGSIPGLTLWVKDPLLLRVVVGGHGPDLVLLWLWALP